MVRREYEQKKMSGSLFVAIISLFIGVLNVGDGARILAVCPTVSISHQLVLRGLAVALNKRGHELVVITTNPLNDPSLKNYTEIDLSILYKIPNCFDTDFIAERETHNMYKFFSESATTLMTHAEKILEHPQVRKLYAPDSNEKFDLILLEMLSWHVFLPFSVRFDAPIVGFLSMGLPLVIHYRMGNPILPSHPSHWEVGTRSSESFVPWQRLNKFIWTWQYLYFLENDFILKQEAITKKYFGNDIPSLRELQRNVSLIFVNQQLPISFVRPNLPNIIEINGFHVPKQPEPLPKDLQSILDEATQGFVYMSLGSNVKSKTMSEELRNEFLVAFSKLPYKVIWKFEEDILPNKPENVIIMKWTPQLSILAHPNIKVFIYQGGLQSTEEAVAHAVPLIGIPVVFDQDMQVNKMVSVGVARKLEISTMNRNDLVEAINDVATDASYKQRMINLRLLMEDRPYDMLENAVWWTEHVIRHRGAPYLRSTFMDEPWYQRQDMDIVAFLSVGSTIVLGLILVISYKLFFLILRVFSKQSSDEKMKIN